MHDTRDISLYAKRDRVVPVLPFMCHPVRSNTLCHIIWRAAVSRSQSPSGRFPSPRQVSYLSLGAYLLSDRFSSPRQKISLPSHLSLRIFNLPLVLQQFANR